jgi:peptidylprolyl isomerase
MKYTALLALFAICNVQALRIFDSEDSLIDIAGEDKAPAKGKDGKEGKKAANANATKLTTLAAVGNKTFFDVTIDGVAQEQIVLGMFDATAPKTVANFLAMLGEGTELEAKDAVEEVPATEKEPGVPASPATPAVHLSFKDTIFHRIIPGFMMQGGDFENGDGTGGSSLYGKKFKDENFKLKFSRPMLLAMANSGPNSNGSQFFITFDKPEWLNGHHVIFGEVLSGQKTIKAIEEIGTPQGPPSKVVKVVATGIIEAEEKK